MSEFPENGKIWFNGKMVNWKDATVHVMAHVLHYGSSVFEGFRCYDHAKGPALFRLADHMNRLFNSAKIYRMSIPYSKEELSQACHDVVKVNELRSAYLRPIVYRGYGSLGVDPKGCPIEVAIAALSWGKYLGEEAIKSGVDVCVSTWTRTAPNTFPAMAKAGSNYMNSQLVKLEAKVNGYVEGICLDTYGHVSEGSGENLFLVMGETLYTPPLSASILPGITRDCVFRIADDFGVKVVETQLPREMLYIADELFFTGSAAEVTPIRSVDRISIGEGRRGPTTEKIQQHMFDIMSGEVEDPYGWLSFVH